MPYGEAVPMSEPTEPTLFEGAITALSISRSPEEVLAEAQKVATVLKDVISQRGLVVKIGKSEHLKCEAWQTLGHFYGLVGRIRPEKTRFVQFGDVKGFEAVAELVHVASGRIISVGDSMCLDDEDHWDIRPTYEYQNGERTQIGEEPVPLFQLRAMAQTRALSHAYANALKWVVVLAGYSPKLAGEQDEGETERPRRAASTPPRRSERQQPKAGTEVHGEKPIPEKVRDIWWRMLDSPSTVKEFDALRAAAVQVMGPAGETEYKRVLSQFGVEQANQFKNLETARRCVNTLWQTVELARDLKGQSGAGKEV
jgi:hypothetical protein